MLKTHLISQISRERNPWAYAVVALLTILTGAANSSAQYFIPVPANDDPLQRMQDAFEDLVARVAPAVVSIESQGGPGEAGKSSEAWTIVGSGSIVRGDGMILTSEHVVHGALSIHVSLADGRRLRARRVAADPRCDLAVIQIDAENLQSLALGNTMSVRRGHIVLAAGNPLGMAGDGHAATCFGMVSAIARPLPDSLGQDEDRYYGDMIQMTAPVGPGYSGGPLVDIRGRIIGVIAAATRPRLAAESLGFAVPLNKRIKSVVKRLLAGEEVEYGYLGVQVRDAAAEGLAAHRFGLATEGVREKSSGVFLQQVYRGGAADIAGLLAGDVVLRIDDQPIHSVDEFVQIVGALGPRAEVRIDYVRDSSPRACKATLTQRSASSARPLMAVTDRQWTLHGATLGAVNPVFRTDATIPQSALMVKLVEAGSPADRAGLTPGDIVVRVDGQTVSPEMTEALNNKSDSCLLGLANGGSVLIKAGK